MTLNGHTPTASLAIAKTNGFHGTAHAPKKRTLCFIVDVKNWAFDNIAKNISKYLCADFDITTLYITDFEDEPSLLKRVFLGETEWDIVHFLWHPLLSSLFEARQFYQVSKDLSEMERRYLISRIASTCKTTAIYDHKYLSDNEHDAMQISTLNLCDGYSVSSARLDKHYRANPNLSDPLGILSDGVDLERFRPRDLDVGSSDRPVKVGWAGNSSWDSSLVDHKGLHSIVKPLIQQFIDEGVRVEGDFCDRAVQWRPAEKMPEYYRSIDLYVCASLNEGTPNPVLESMASGVPVLTTDVGIVKEVFGPLQKQFVVADRTSEEFGEKFRLLVSDSNLRRRLAEENLVSVKECSWEKRAQDWLEFFNSALEQKRTSSQTKFQLNALFHAFDAGRLHFTAISRPPATPKKIKTVPHFLFFKVKRWISRE
ncbi:MAG: glycosyltransferase, partial [Bdellovibrionales bacterium]|nr:glycosyltransferase [Bdellovibrionales bacterium]